VRQEIAEFVPLIRTAPRSDLTDASVDLVLLFAVLTCIPDQADQHAVVAEISRLLKPGGLLYVSDLLLQDDARHRERYDAFASDTGVYGAFRSTDGGVFRHHERGWFTTLLGRFDLIHERLFSARTMNGNSAAGIQLLARVPDRRAHD
jgi:SAM-dependent methyltransferase